MECDLFVMEDSQDSSGEVRSDKDSTDEEPEFFFDDEILS